MNVFLKYSQQYRDDPLLFSNSLWRSLTCTLVLMFKYMYTGPTALRDLRTMEQLEWSALLKGTRSSHKFVAPVGLEPTPGSHSCIQSLMLYPLRHASLSIFPVIKITVIRQVRILPASTAVWAWRQITRKTLQGGQRL